MSRPIQVPDRQPAPSFVRERGSLLFATLISVFLASACSQEIKRAEPVVVSPEILDGGMVSDPGVEPAPSSMVKVAGDVEFRDGEGGKDETAPTIGDDEDILIERIVINELPVGKPYPIDGLVGQINGRPVFADEFLLPMEDRILRIVAESPAAQAVRDVDGLVTSRFQEFVNNELIIAEAESHLSFEQQQGVLAWVQGVQEQTITDRGGTRDSAARSIEDEFGISLDEFMSQRRSVALAQDLLRKRVQPRAIVSWRDVEQAYRREFAMFNPPARVSIGRIRLHRERQAEQIAMVKKSLEEGNGFLTTLEAVDPGADGEWLDLELPADGIEGTSLATPVKALLDLEHPGEVGGPLEQGPFISWFTVLGVDQPAGRTIYDHSVQIGLENQLSGLRYSQEQERYLASLKDRWVTGDIVEMRNRLVSIARTRYFGGR